MEIYKVLWDHKCKPHWPPEPGDLEVSPEWQLQKLGLQRNIHGFIWEILESRSNEEGQCTLASTGLCSSGAALQAPTCLLNLKPDLQAEAPGKQMGLFHRKSRGVFQSAVSIVSWGW